MPYLPKNQYETKFTNGGELYNPADGNEYMGYYIKYRNKFFAGNSPQNLKTKLRKIEEATDNKVYNTTTFLYNQLNKKFYQKTKNRKGREREKRYWLILKNQIGVGIIPKRRKLQAVQIRVRTWMTGGMDWQIPEIIQRDEVA